MEVKKNLQDRINFINRNLLHVNSLSKIAIKNP